MQSKVIETNISSAIRVPMRQMLARGLKKQDDDPITVATSSLRSKPSMSAVARFRELSAKQQATESESSLYRSFAYSALASFKMGMSESASFQRVRKSW